MKKIAEVTMPYFEERFHVLGHWVYRGFTFEVDGGNALHLFQVFNPWGGATGDPEISSKWELYSLSAEGKLENIASDGIINGGDYLSSDPDNEYSEAHRKRKHYGLSVELIAELMEYARERQLSRKDTEKTIVAEIQPILEKEIGLAKDAMAKLQDLTMEQLRDLARDLLSLARKTGRMYPRSQEKLLELVPLVRKRYIELKYPGFYADMKKLSDNKSRGIDPDDEMVGFGPHFALGDIFHDRFERSAINDPGRFDTKLWDLGSPFEKKWAASVFFL